MRTLDTLHEPDIILFGISTEELNRHKKAVREGRACVSGFRYVQLSDKVSTYYARVPSSVRYHKTIIDENHSN